MIVKSTTNNTIENNPSHLGNKTFYSFRIYTLVYEEYIFYYYDPEFKGIIIAFFNCLKEVYKCSLSDIIQNLTYKQSLDIIDYCLLLFCYKPLDINDQALMYKRLVSIKRLLMLSTINIFMFLHTRDLIYLYNKRFQVTNTKTSLHLANLKLDFSLLDIFDKLNFNLKNHINIIVNDIHRRLEIYERKNSLSIILEDSTILSNSQKDLLNKFCIISPLVKDKSITFKNLMYLLINNNYFVSSIIDYTDQSYFKQIKRHLHELLIWFRFIRFCIDIINKNTNRFTKQDIKDFDVLRTFNDKNIKIFIDPKTPFSTKKGKKILYLLRQATDYYTADVFMGSIHFISKVLTIYNEKK